MSGVDRHVLEALVADLGAYPDDQLALSTTACGLRVRALGRGGDAAAALAEVARRRGAPKEAIDAFLACDRAFRGREVGIEVGFGPDACAPSLHHETAAPKEEVLVFLSAIRSLARAIPSLSRALEPSRAVEGLAFTAVRGDLLVEVWPVPAAPHRERPAPLTLAARRSRAAR